MKTEDKLKHISSLGQSANDLVATVLTPGADNSEVRNFLRKVMSLDQLLLWDLAEYWEAEAIKCAAAGSHFSGMICSVSMNEAFLSYLCLVNADAVRGTRQFRQSAKGGLSKEINRVLGDWSLKHLVSVASELNWLPIELIDNQMKDLLAAVFEEMSNDPLPNEFNIGGDGWQENLQRNPGLTMLQLTQDLRNYAHPNRWIRKQGTLKAASFTQWCDIATRLSGEIRNALLMIATRGQTKPIESLRAQIADIQSSMSVEQFKTLERLLRIQIEEKTGFTLADDFNLSDLIGGLSSLFPVKQS